MNDKIKTQTITAKNAQEIIANGGYHFIVFAHELVDQDSLAEFIGHDVSNEDLDRLEQMATDITENQAIEVL